MKQVVIENPIINSPFSEPQRHFRFDDEGITDQIVGSRRISSYFIPVAQPKNCMPDLIVHVDDGHGREDPLKLIMEMTGEATKEKEARTSTAQTLWISAVDNAGTWGRWAFVEISDPWDAEKTIRGVFGKRK